MLEISCWAVIMIIEEIVKLLNSCFHQIGMWVSGSLLLPIIHILKVFIIKFSQTMVKITNNGENMGRTIRCECRCKYLVSH